MHHAYTARPVRIHVVPDIVPVEGYYRYNTQGRFPLLQKLCFAVLKRLKCESVYIDQKVKFFEFNTEDLVRIIMESSDAMYELTTKRAKYVVMGHDYYERLVKDTDYMTHWMFEFPHHYMSPQYKPNDVFSGIKVVFIPWMEGMVVLPEMPK